MGLEHWLLFLHVLGAIVWIGGGLTLSLVGWRARSSGDLSVAAEFSKTLRRVGLPLFTPALLVVLATGLVMALDGSGGRFSQPWILIGIALFLLAFLIGAVYMSRAGIAVERAVSGPAGDASAVTSLIGRWLVGYGVVLLLLVVAVWDMVFKPFS